jgi:short-subunit dehydrogenase
MSSLEKHGWVVVTGASRGIGRALALELSRRGHAIVGAARSASELETLAKAIGEGGGRCLTVTCDLGTHEGRAKLEEACGALELVGLVNNAGFGTAGPFAEVDRAKDVEMLRLNVEALTDLCHAFLPQLKGRPGAFIANVASTASFQPVPLFAAYAATKAYVLSFSEALAEELAPEGIHVVALCPGLTESGFQAVANVVIPAGGAPTSEEVARWAADTIAAKKRVAVHGFKNALLAWGTRFSPRFLTVKAAAKTMEPWFAGRKSA